MVTYPRHSHSLVNSTKPGALVSPLPVWTTKGECLAVLWQAVSVDTWLPACSYLSSHCEGCSSWCRYRTGWTRTQTWKSPETWDILYSKFKRHISISPPTKNQQTCNTCACLTCMWQPAAMVVGIMVKLTASTWPTAEVWLAWTLVGVTGPSWVKNAKAWDSQPPPRAVRVQLCAKCSLCTIPWL